MRTIPYCLLCGLALGLSLGCEHLTESRVVTAFAESLKEHDLERMKAGSSSEFENKAVQGDDTFRALKLIDLPEGMPRVVKVVDKKDEDSKKVVEKKVVAVVGKNRRRIMFRLIPDEKSGRWVVDDLIFNPNEYGENRSSLATRLAVLLSFQESIDAWKSGDRDRILAASTPELSGALSSLAPEQLEQFARKLTSSMATENIKILPDERVGEETAELRVAKEKAELVLKFRRAGERWKLDDLALESKRSGEDVASVQHMASAIAAALQFEAAYRTADKRTLQQVCTPRFFQGSLAGADLSLVKLPEHGPALDGFDTKLDGTTATFIVPAGSEMLKITLQQQPLQEFHSVPRFLVDEATIYDLASTQDKRISSLFTAHATMETFAAALAARDLTQLSKNATFDFKRRVWEKIEAEDFSGLPGSFLTGQKPRVLQTRFRGSLTEVLVEQGELPLTYMLREEVGRLLVDDVVSPAVAWPESLKSTAELLLPVLQFTKALRISDMSAVRGCATSDFSRSAWNHLERAPVFEPDPQALLRTALSGINLAGEDRAEVVFGDPRQGAIFSLTREAGEFRVDDVTLVTGPQAEQRIPLKRTIRAQLAQGN